MNVEFVSGTAAGEWVTLLERERAEAEFALLVERQSRFVFRIAYAVVRNVEDAEDVVQDAFFKLFRSGAWRQIEDERAFLARVVWRLAVSRRPRERPVAESAAPEMVCGRSSPEGAAIVSERSRTIHRIIEALPERLRRPLSLCSIEDMKTAEIAAVMDLPEGTVRRLLSEARAFVREKMSRMEGGRNE